METHNSDSGIELRPHSYDGIQEYDQKLLNWWLFTFYITIAWFVIYWVAYYQLKLVPTDEEQLGAAIAKIDAARLKQLEGMDDAKLWALSQDQAVVEKGKATFMTTCLACHGPDLMGKKSNPVLPGPALVDQEWKYGHNPTDVLKLVRKGSPDLTKGMPPWEPVLGVGRVVEVVAFVMSHHKAGEPFTVAADAPQPAAPAPAVTPGS
ncbi:MAG: cbb3-type cytochrome c oxidase N-terminal domain-containing protein [Roseimicrobium sp.]